MHRVPSRERNHGTYLVAEARLCPLCGEANRLWHTLEIIWRFRRLRHVFAQESHTGDKLKNALRQFGQWIIEIIKRLDAAKSFEVSPR